MKQLSNQIYNYQPNNPPLADTKIDALYCRLSRDDDHYGDSSSIQTQKVMLLNYATQNGLNNPVIFVNDGYTGTNFNRPDFQKLLALIDKNLVRSLTVKDLSHFGRDYLQTGHYIENVFPDSSVRFIAIDDNVDSNNGYNEFMPFRNIMNGMLEIFQKRLEVLIKGIKTVCRQIRSVWIS